MMVILANLLVDEGRVTYGDFCLIICKFIAVFPQYLPGLPLICEIEFIIDLVLGIYPISISSCRMARAGLRELKTQLEELQDREFIRPSASPWGAPVLFAKKKDGPL